MMLIRRTPECIARGVLIAMLAAACAYAPLTLAEVTAARDLAAVIALQGLPCGEVTAVERRAENDYVATCSNGTRYRVSTSTDGRVTVQKQ